jgi:hypothetical protein
MLAITPEARKKSISPKPGLWDRATVLCYLCSEHLRIVLFKLKARELQTLILRRSINRKGGTEEQRMDTEEGSKVRVGDKAQNFTLPDQSGALVSLKDFIGSRIIVLYFYPKDFTRGHRRSLRV